ncbi:TetR/AcrR family transcriptional regulator [Micromonospora sp. 067-2]|uniref:TetR/AcrR family transcriptional regulator n=1 Tax=Micromonospora sp. 067-2 TaxID=2789270 RepID=UPI00397D0721
MTPQEPRSLRSDARDNRDRILDVARATFARDGVDVSMRDIARRAKVGVATLYRRFPTKEALVTEAFAVQMVACTEVFDEAVADPDPWRGFCTLIEKITAMQAADRSFTAAIVATFPQAVDVGQARERVLRSFAELTRRAKEAGRLRQDFVLEDLLLLLMANGGIRAATPAAALAASRRLVALMIQSFRADLVSAPLPPAVRLPLLAAY